MVFDSDCAVDAIRDASEALIKLRRSRARVRIDVHSGSVDLETKPAIKAAADEAKQAFHKLIELVSLDGIGYGEGGLDELLFRSIRQVLICEHSFLCSLTRQYVHAIPWCASAQPILKLLSHAIEYATAMLLKGREDHGQTAKARISNRSESASAALFYLQDQGNNEFGDWLLEGMFATLVPEIVCSCERLWLVLNISNVFRADNFRRFLR